MPADKVLFDANCLHKLYLRHLLLTLSSMDLIHPLWTERILVETATSITRRFPDQSDSISERILGLHKFFGSSLVEGFEYLIGSLGCSDTDDEHVLAAAVHAGASTLMTFNVSDFPKDSSARLGVEVMHPDTYLHLLAQTNKKAVIQGLARWLSYFHNPKLTALEGAAALKKAECPTLAGWLIGEQEQVEGKLEWFRKVKKA